MTIAEMIVVAWCVSVSFNDLHARRIPNTLTLGVCVIAIAWLITTGHAVLGASWQSVMLGVAISSLLGLPAYIARLLGAGDVKLLLAISILSGYEVMLCAFVIASILAIIFWMADSLLARLDTRAIRVKRWIPFGAALSIGMLFSMVVAP